MCHSTWSDFYVMSVVSWQYIDHSIACCGVYSRGLSARRVHLTYGRVSARRVHLTYVGLSARRVHVYIKMYLIQICLPSIENDLFINTLDGFSRPEIFLFMPTLQPPQNIVPMCRNIIGYPAQGSILVSFYSGPVKNTSLERIFRLVYLLR